MAIGDRNAPHLRRAFAIGALSPLVLMALAWAFVLLRPGALPHTYVVVSTAAGAERFELPGWRRLPAFLQEKAGLLEQRSLQVETGFHDWRPSYAELGARFDAGQMLEQARQLGRAANPLLAWRALFRALFGSGHVLRWVPRLDDARLRAYVAKLEAQIKRDPIPGTWDADGHPIEGIPGEELNTDTTSHAIESALLAGAQRVAVQTQVINAAQIPRVSFDRFSVARAPALSTQVLTQQTTSYRQGTGRARNIALAASKLDGSVMLPGQQLSFNARVGKRTVHNGFQPAPEVRNGRLVDPAREPCPECVGGGVCQVAGTLHAAAFFAGLDVIEQAPHSRLPEVCYLPPGLDSAVAWDPAVDDVARTKDLIIRNPYPFPVVVRTHTGEGKVTVTLWGAMRPYRVDCCYAVDRDHTAQQGQAGVTITRVRTVYKPDARPVERSRVSYSDPETCMFNRGWTMRCDPCSS